MDQKRVSSPSLAIILLVCSAVWFVGACIWYGRSASKDGWSSTPLVWTFILAVTPLLCVVDAVALLMVRRRSGFKWLDWCAFVAGSLPVTAGSWLAFMVLRSMRDMGIL
jgi:hypothetical protein